MPERRTTNAQRRAVVRQAQGCCEYCRCQERFSPDSFSVEHIVPRSRSGGGGLDNLAFACQGCNNRKFVSTQAIDPVTGMVVSLFHPRRDTWTQHFAWNEEFTLIVGLTQEGRATVEKLDLNRTGVVNLRRVLFVLGIHPALD